MDAPGRQHLHQGTLNHENGRLGELNLVQLLLARRETGIAQRCVRVFPPFLLDGIDHPPEYGIRVVEIAPAPCPLRTLSREHHGHPAVARFHRGDAGGVFHEGVQCLDQLRAAADRERRARGEPGAAPAQIPGQRVEVGLPPFEVLAQASRALLEGLRRPRREGDHVAGVGRQRHRPFARSVPPVLPHDAVSVRAAEPEGVDPDHDRAVRERLAGGLHLDGPEVEIDLRVRNQVVLRDGGERPPLHHEDDLQQRTAERRRLEVSHVALHTGHAEGRLALDAAERLGNGVSFDAVAHDRAGRVRLHVVEVLRPQSRAPAGLAHEFDLRMARRRRDVAPLGESGGVIGGPGRVDRRGFDRREDVVSVPLGRLQRLHGEHERALRPHVAIGVGVEGMAPAIRTYDAECVEGGAAAGGPQVGGGAHQSLLAIALTHRVHRRVKRGQRRRASGGGRDRRPHEVEMVGDPVRQHRGVDAQDGELVGPEQGAPVRGGGDLGSDEDARAAVAEGVQAPAGVFAAFPCAAQQHPDLRIHIGHFMV